MLLPLGSMCALAGALVMAICAALAHDQTLASHVGDVARRDGIYRKAVAGVYIALLVVSIGGVLVVVSLMTGQGVAYVGG